MRKRKNKDKTTAETMMEARRVKRSRENPIESRKSSKKTNEVAKDLGLDLTDPRQRRKAQSRAIARGLKKQGKTNKTINPKTDELVRSRYGKITDTDKIMPKPGEAQKAKELVDKYNKRGRPRKGLSPYRKNIRPDILDDISKKTPPENQFNSYNPLDEERYKRSPKLKKYDDFLDDARNASTPKKKLKLVRKATDEHNQLKKSSPKDIL